MIEINNKTRSNINLRLVKLTTEKFLKFNKKNNYNISIAFVGDRVIQKLNKAYRDKDKITDILSFKGENNFLGEIIIDYLQIKRQAKKFSNSVKNELVYILVHGLFHLLGYDDKTEKGRKEMEQLANNFIKKIVL